MLRSLRSRLAVTHMAIGLIAVAALGVLAYRAAEVSLFAQLETEMFQVLHIHAGQMETVEGNPNLAKSITTLSQAVGGRALALNSLGRVVADSLSEGSLVGKVIVLDEIPDALAGKTVSAIYEVQRGRFLYCAVPVTSAGKVQGVLFTATRLDSMYRRLNRFVMEMGLSILGVTFVLAVLSVFIALLLGNPWSRLVRVLENAPVADYRHRIPARGKTEIARLARAYNLMADRLQRTEQARRDFVVEASTELEEPLKTILSTVESGQGDLRKRLDTIGELARSMSLTTDQLLDLARLEMDTDPLRPETLDLGQIVNDVVAAAEPDAAQAGVSLKRDDAIDTAVEMRADRKRLFAALLGLTRYCLATAGESGSVRLAVTEDQINAFFSVRGSGPDLPPEDIPVIFERFLVRRQATGSGMLPEKTGAGLAIARRVVELHGGAMEVKANPGGGVTFFARIPKKGLDAHA